MGREVLTISLGDDACTLNTHWQNLQTAAIVNEDIDRDVTHAISEETYVARSLWIARAPQVRSLVAVRDEPQYAWSGKVEEVQASGDYIAISDEKRSLDQAIESLAKDPFSQFFAKRETFSASLDNPRHVDWDDLGEEEQEDVPEEVRREQYRNREASVRRQSQLYWENAPAPTSWVDYFTPPNSTKMLCSMPVDNAESNESYLLGFDGLRSWKEDMVEERVRDMLEQCDSCQGTLLMSSNTGIWAGLGSYLLNWLHEECPSSKRWLFTCSSQQYEKENAPDRQSLASRQRETLCTIEEVLCWKEAAESAHLITPLSRTDITTAAALECATIPYRLSSSSQPCIGLNSYYYGSFSGNSMFGSASSLSLAELCKTLEASGNRKITELDALIDDSTNTKSLWSKLFEGTSLEADQRMRYHPELTGMNKPRQILPGRWMQDAVHEGGLLSTLSPHRDSDRDKHHHYALVGGLRTGIDDHTSADYIECILQGMGVRYRPEQSLTTILRETHGVMSQRSVSSYWSPFVDMPTLAILGNTTRSYRQLEDLTQRSKRALANRGLWNRQLFPEEEDCRDALTGLYDLRDSYLPPEGNDEFENPELD